MAGVSAGTSTGVTWVGAVTLGPPIPRVRQLSTVEFGAPSARAAADVPNCAASATAWTFSSCV